MSRIGKKTIELPAGVTVTVANSEVKVKGPKGELKQTIHGDITVEVQDNTVTVNRPSDQISHRAMHGLYRSLIANMVKGVTEGFSKKLELVGVGFKASNTGNVLDLALGYSHNIIFEIPKELSLETLTEKGANPIITLNGTDKQLLGQVAAKIRSLRKPEPYKGKGVKYVGEYIRRKAGKSAGK
ncbi:MAG: 50S ribosomal protein L6 [Chitinophagaceae bacterium]|nr:50S ribosomal protein L6 [Chitinophagaceae bacterium]